MDSRGDPEGEGRGVPKKNALASRRDSRVAIRRINDSVSGVFPSREDFLDLETASLSFRDLEREPKIVAIRSREWSRERLHKSTFCPFNVDEKARRVPRRVSTRTSTRSASV